MTVTRGYDSICCFRSGSGEGVRVLIELTSDCNHRCTYCHSAPSGSHEVSLLSTHDYLRLFAEGAARGWTGVILSGGEPLLRHDILEIMAGAREQGLSVDLCTNATLIDNAMSQALANYLSEVSVSLDGPPGHHDSRRGRGTFARTITGLRWLIRAGLSVHLITVVDGQTPADIRDLMSIAAGERVDSISLLGLMNVGSNNTCVRTKDSTKLLRLARECAGSALTVNSKRLCFEPPLGECPAGKTVFAVSASGYLRPCILLDSPGSSDVRGGLDQAISAFESSGFGQQLALRGGSCSVSECGMGCPAEAWAADMILGCDRQCACFEQ